MNKNELTTPGRRLAWWQVSISTLFVLLATLITYVFEYAFFQEKTQEKSYAFSVFIGGTIAIIPHVIFAFKAFRYAGATSSKKVMESFYSGVKLKTLYTALLFALSFKFLTVVPLVLLVTFCLVVFLLLVLPVILTKLLN